MLLIYFILLLVMGFATFALYGLDKRRAGTQQRRFRERTLLLLCFAGGWLGGYIGQRVYRHKTRKFSYQLLFWTITIVHLTLVVAIMIRFGAAPVQ